MSTPETIKLLTEIRDELRKLNHGKAPGGTSASYIADDADLDSKYGDELIKFNPRDNAGESVKGLHMSECPADVLDMLASSYDYFAQKNEESGKVSAKGNPVAPYDRKSASRARGWAARIRAGKVTPKPAPVSSGNAASARWDEPADDVDDSSLPF